MIVVNLKGGLGNQMFQYAAGRILAGDSTVYLDHTYLNNNTVTSDVFTARSFELDIFKHLNAKPASKRALKVLHARKRIYSLIRGALRRTKLLKLSTDDDFTLESEKRSHYLLHYLDGYFQDAAHFKSFESIIYKTFTFPGLSVRGQEVKDHIAKQENTVALHIRRGDYVKPLIGQFHGLLALDYYHQAIKTINDKVGSAQYFVFSDDPEWCKVNLDFVPNKYIVDIKGANWEDMYLMSQCKHNIIANSSYSWWGAWLNQNPEKIVVAPNKWFVDTESKIIPEEWLSL